MPFPTDFKCPVCKAPKGFPCRDRRGHWVQSTHNRRTQLARGKVHTTTHAGVTGETTDAKSQ